MARVNRVTKSREVHTCEVGQHEIPKGSPYLWAKPGFRVRRKRIRCTEHPFRPSDLATGLNQEPMAAQESFDDTLGTLEQFDYEGLNQAVAEFRDALEEYRDLRQEALDAWENGNATLEEYLDTAEEALSNLEDLDEFEDLDDEPQREDYEEGEDGDDEFDTAVDEYEQERVDHWDECVNEASEASAAVSL